MSHVDMSLNPIHNQFECTIICFSRFVLNVSGLVSYTKHDQKANMIYRERKMCLIRLVVIDMNWLSRGSAVCM